MNVDVYMHVATLGRYQSIAKELSVLIERTGLEAHARRLFVSVVGNGTVPYLGAKWSNIINAEDVNAYEYPTLRHVWHDVQEDDAPGATLYVHVKGASYLEAAPRDARDAWRRYMAYFCIERWADCLERLAMGFDVVGTEHREANKRMGAHFAGNFWWASHNYLRKKDAPAPYRDRKHIRYGAETWLLRPPSAPRVWNWMDFRHKYDLGREVLPATEYRHDGSQRADGVR